MLVKAKLEDEKSIVKTIIRNHGIDNPIMLESMTQKLFNELDIQRKKTYN